MHIRCPHCHNPIEVVDADPLTDLICTSCGSNFSLISGETASYTPGDVRTIAHFELLESVGTGRFGTVWKARDTKLDRTVAVKIPRRGQIEGPEAEMFIREARAAAQVKHPGVVDVHEVGREDGTLYIVSDFIDGCNLKDWLSGRRLTPREAAELCMKIAEALEVAHEAGVVHRDLKPGNVMMDLAGQPHLTDFGLAKREAGEITMTVDGQVLGTPAYMSPEQARGEAHAADRRSDVWSLGVILFELLTGEVPFRGNQRMMVVQILHDEPPSPRKLQTRVPRDLETICLKCLEKPPGKRYQSAAEVAAELGRFLHGEPVVARPIGRTARFWRWCKRQPEVAGLTAAVAATLIAGTIVSSVFAVKAYRERDRAEKARQSEANRAEAERLAKVDAERQKNRAEAGEKLARERLVEVAAEKSKAENEKQIAQAVQVFLQYKLLGQADARTQADTMLWSGGLSAELKENPTIRELLDRAARELAPERIDANFPNQPLVQAAILRTVGNAYEGVGEYDRGIGFLRSSLALYEQHLGREHPDTLESMSSLATAYSNARKLDLALPLDIEALKLWKAKLGPEHPYTLRSMTDLAMDYGIAGKLDLALPLFEETLKLQKAKLGPDHPDTLNSMRDLAMAYADAGKLDDALPLLMQALKLQKATLGPEHPDTLRSMTFLATAYSNAGKLDLALPLFEETLKVQKAKLGPEHPDTLTSMTGLATAYSKAGKLDLALPLYTEALRVQKAKLGADHPDTLWSMTCLATAYKNAGMLDLALPLYEQAFKLRKAKLGVDHRDTLQSMDYLAGAYQKAGKMELARPLLEEAMKLRNARQAADRHHMLAGAQSPTQGKLNVGRRDFDALSLRARFPSARKLVSAGYKPSWSRDGRHLSFSRLSDGGIGIFDVETLTVSTLIALGKDPAWSPRDANRIAFVRGSDSSDEELWITDAAGKDPKRIATGGWPTWAQDGKSLFYNSNKDRKIMKIGVDPPGEPVAVCDMPYTKYPAITADGKRVAYPDRENLVVLDIPSRKPLATRNLGRWFGFFAGWSPDRKLLAYGSYGGEGGGSIVGLWIMKVETGQAVRVAEGPFTAPAWSRDGLKLAFDLRANGGREIWMIETKELEKLWETPAKESPAPLPPNQVPSTKKGGKPAAPTYAKPQGDPAPSLDR